jgi:hypothetical protein
VLSDGTAAVLASASAEETIQTILNFRSAVLVSSVKHERRNYYSVKLKLAYSLEANRHFFSIF